VGILPDNPVETFVDLGRQAVAPLVDLAEQGNEAATGAFSHLAADAQQAATHSYDKVAGWLAGLATSAQEYADALGRLSPEQFTKFMDFVNAIDSLKSLSGEIQSLQSHFDGLEFRDFLSGTNKTYAVALAEKTAMFLNLVGQLFDILSDLINLFGDGLKDKLRAANLPLLKQQLNLW